ncbi:MAG: hypothetical protein Q7R96_06440 [Nanoarchaeota archaeon]|nr:hypothetical protein [Nanoarchaeota archaeon]
MDYQGLTLRQCAQHIAERMDLPLCTPRQERDKHIETAIRSFANPTDYFITFVLHLHKGINYDVPLMGERDETLIYYAGDIGKTIEALYITTQKKAISTTYDARQDIGVLEVTDITGSIVLQELSQVRQSMGRAVVVRHADLPAPRALTGAAQFRKEDFRKLQTALETLLELKK